VFQAARSGCRTDPADADRRRTHPERADGITTENLADSRATSALWLWKFFGVAHPPKTQRRSDGSAHAPTKICDAAEMHGNQSRSTDTPLL
jgi:hypothetical protein